MSEQLFKKAIVFCDIHFGLKNNSKDHNEDCIDFLNWVVKTAKENDVDTCIFLGDYHHHRNNINALTQHYMLESMNILNTNFNKTYFLVGNHDLYFRSARNITSSRFATLYDNIELIDEPVTIGNVALVPWLIEDEWKEITKLKTKYLFGHLELPGFKMNATVEMPDHGTLNASHFKHQDYVFSGHFHKRQSKGKINYIGNPFGHNFSDVWDFDRGAMIIEWDKEPEYVNYEDGPRYINISLSSLLANPELYLKPKTYLQVVLDCDISYEEATYMREAFLEQYKIREFKLVRNQAEEISHEYDGDVTVKTVNQIVIECLGIVESDSLDKNKLIEIYNRL